MGKSITANHFAALPKRPLLFVNLANMYNTIDNTVVTIRRHTYCGVRHSFLSDCITPDDKPYILVGYSDGAFRNYYLVYTTKAGNTRVRHVKVFDHATELMPNAPSIGGLVLKPAEYYVKGKMKDEIIKLAGKIAND